MRDVQGLINNESLHLRNLPETFKDKIDLYNSTPFVIREFFAQSKVPFRFKGCERHLFNCCGACTRPCHSRCPQDVLQRAYMLCGYIIADPSRYQGAPFLARMLYDEITSKEPKYFVIEAMIFDNIKENKNETVQYNYAPEFEYEEYFAKKSNEFRTHKKVSPETGEAAVLYWPRSGMCPFCSPLGLVDLRRTIGDKARRKSLKY